MTKIQNYTSEDEVFKSLEQLAKDNPEEFELKRDEIIKAFIKTLPDKYQKRMECFQWSIDRTRDKAKTPLAACIAISNMMFNSVHNLHKQAREIQMDISGESDPKNITENTTARIIDFKFS